MKCINKAFLLSFIISAVLLFAGCGKKEYTMEFDRNMNFDEEGNAILKEGTRVTCKDIAYVGLNTWMRKPAAFLT